MPDWLLEVVKYAAGAGALYAGIRADLAALHVKAETAKESATTAHARIDSIMAGAMR